MHVLEEAQRNDATHDDDSLRDFAMRQAGSVQPVVGDPVGRQPATHDDREADAQCDDLDAAHQVANEADLVGASLVARHLERQRRRQAQVQQRQQRLQQHEDADQAVGLDAEVADVERHEGQTHQGAPALTEVVGDDVSSELHVRRVGCACRGSVPNAPRPVSGPRSDFELGAGRRSSRRDSAPVAFMSTSSTAPCPRATAARAGSCRARCPSVARSRRARKAVNWPSAGQARQRACSQAVSSPSTSSMQRGDSTKKPPLIQPPSPRGFSGKPRTTGAVHEPARRSAPGAGPR